jgi:hypothetical protein
MLNWKVVTKTVSSFSAITYVLCMRTDRAAGHRVVTTRAA